MTHEQGGGPPNTEALRAARHNIRYHLGYIGWLVQTRDWLAGNRLTLADLAAAAHLSAVDYLGEVPWNANEATRNWYARVKSVHRSGRFSATRWPVFRHRKLTPTSTSERPGCDKGGAHGKIARGRIRCHWRRKARRCTGVEIPTRTLSRRRRARRHDVALIHSRTPRVATDPVARRALDRHARNELRARR